MSAEGQASARARTENVLEFVRRPSAASPARQSSCGGRNARQSMLGVLGAVTAAALGASVAGGDLVRPAAASAPMHLSFIAAQSERLTGTAAVALAPAALMPEAPGRVTLIFSLSDATLAEEPRPDWADWGLAAAPVPPANPQETAWQEAVMVPDRPLTSPATPVFRRAQSEAQSAPPPAPVMKPPLAARASAADPIPSVVQRPRASSASVSAMVASFAAFGYDLDQVRASVKPVPRLYLSELPPDLANVSSIATKKRLFVQSVLPIILRVNEEVATARWRVERLGQRLLWDGALSDADRSWLIDMAELYGAAPFDVPGLLKRMDVVPPSLALAQAAEETGWGTSRFVREGNALFGQYTYKPAMGMMPERRDADRRHRVRSHNNLLDAVRAYVHNLNSHWAYEDFRDRRALLRHAGRPMDGYDLAGSMGQYSERRADYIRSIRKIMRQNRLRDFDRAWLNERQWTALIGQPGEQPI